MGADVGDKAGGGVGRSCAWTVGQKAIDVWRPDAFSPAIRQMMEGVKAKKARRARREKGMGRGEWGDGTRFPLPIPPSPFPTPFLFPLACVISTSLYLTKVYDDAGRRA
jgi:hypothetical protein